jgi:prepilin-type N-terminal cleavage/methylation domain-containing protein
MMKKSLNGSNDGFTLIEIIVILAIISVIAGIVVLSVIHILHNSREKVCQSSREELKRTLQIYKTGGGTFDPDGETGIQFLIDSGYYPQNKKICPSNGLISWGLDDDGNVEVYCSIHKVKENIIFKSNFSTIDKVKMLMGSWVIRDGKLVPGRTGENRAVFEGSNGTDYNIKMNAVYLSGSSSSSGYGAYYRATDSTNISGYCFQFDPGLGNDFVVRKVTDGREGSPFQRIDMATAMGNGFMLNDPHDIEIDVRGDRHIIKVDGVEIMNFVDSTYSEGHVGVRTWNNSNVEISEVIIE